jgi:carbonic anhydrase/acetyltransferase-like protein (isoleucine patch superfamily)
LVAEEMGELARPLVLAVNGISPKIAPDVFIAPGAVVVGDVEIGPGSSVWFQAAIRGDVAPVRIGARSNVQEGAVLHVDPDAPCIVGDDVTIGHGAIVHGTTVGNGVTVGMGSILLSRSRIGDRAVVAAGSVVAEGTVVAPGALVMGVPAREKRILDEERQLKSVAGATGYVANAARFKATLADVTEAWQAQQNGDDGDGG